MLKKGWVVALLGGLNYLAVTAALITPANLRKAPDVVHVVPEPERYVGASWEFFDPDVDRFLEETTQKKKEMAAMEQRLNDLQTRVMAETAELLRTTQSIHRLKLELETFVIWLTAEEEANLVKLGETYSAMTPESASVIFREMQDDQIIRVMLYMKPEVNATVLEGLAKIDSEQAARAAKLTEDLRKAIKRKRKT